MSVWPTLGADPVLESTGGHASSQHYINSTVKASSWRMTLKFIAETVARKLFPCVLNVLLCCAVMWTFWRSHCVQYCDVTLLLVCLQRHSTSENTTRHSPNVSWRRANLDSGCWNILANFLAFYFITIFSSTVIKTQRNRWVDWVNCRCLSS